MCVSKVCVDKFCVDKLCVSKCGQVVCGQVVCGQVVCGQVVCEEVVCVCVLWRRKAAGGGQEKAGVQNQKQEPHTKMWGKKCFQEVP